MFRALVETLGVETNPLATVGRRVRRKEKSGSVLGTASHSPLELIVGEADEQSARLIVVAADVAVVLARRAEVQDLGIRAGAAVTVEPVAAGQSHETADVVKSELGGLRLGRAVADLTSLALRDSNPLSVVGLDGETLRKLTSFLLGVGHASSHSSSISLTDITV